MVPDHATNHVNDEVSVNTEKMNRSDNGCCNRRDISEDLIVNEILSRSRVKPLTRFKCVCKRWKFLIEQDEHFINLHLARSKTRPCLLITGSVPDSEDPDSQRSVFLTAELLIEVFSVAVPTIVMDEQTDRWTTYSTLGPVNGVICLVEKMYRKPRVDIRLWNLSNQQVTHSIRSDEENIGSIEEISLIAGNIEIQLVNCELGFSPATKEHKVICIWHLINHYAISLYNDAEYCKVMTVGDNKWRKIDEVPQYKIQPHGASVYVNGCIYFITRKLVKNAGDIARPKFIIAFDVDTEKFRSIKTPSFTYRDHHDLSLREVDGRLALIIRTSYNSVKLALLHDSHNWTEVNVELPINISDNSWFLDFHPILGTDQIIIHMISAVYMPIGDADDSSLYCVNWKNKSFRNIDISGIPSDIFKQPSCTKVNVYVESLFPMFKQKGMKIDDSSVNERGSSHKFTIGDSKYMENQSAEPSGSFIIRRPRSSINP